MKFTMTKIVASIGFAISGGNAQAVLNSANTLSIQADAVSTYVEGGPSTSNTGWIVSSDGPLVDSFYTLGGSKTKQTLGTQYSFLYSSADLTLNGAPQTNIASLIYYFPGDLQTVGTGISILSASGDTATVDMSGLTFNWNGYPNYLGTRAWSSGYTNGVGNITCETGSECAIGSAYTLKYTATVTTDTYADLAGVKFYFELHGTVGAVPEASTYSMMLVGLGLLGAAVRRRTH